MRNDPGHSGHPQPPIWTIAISPGEATPGSGAEPLTAIHSPLAASVRRDAAALPTIRAWLAAEADPNIENRERDRYWLGAPIDLVYPPMDHASIEQQFATALDALIVDVKEDRSIVAAILCGSLSHDTVWAKSDIDLVLVTIDDKKVKEGSLSLYADGVNIHAMLMPRAQFRSLADGSIRNSFAHSFLAKGRLLYTHDDTIAELCEQLREIGERDTRIQLLRAGTHALGPMYKAHKWLVTRGDLEYSALWILYAATPLARIEIVGRRLLADREVIPQASKLNPEFFRAIYSDLLNEKKTRARVDAALHAMDTYMQERAPTLFAPVIDYLRDVGEARSCTEIENHFERNHDIAGVTLACEYLADQGLIGKASIPVQLTKRSNVAVEELAFYPLEP